MPAKAALVSVTGFLCLCMSALRVVLPIFGSTFSHEKVLHFTHFDLPDCHFLETLYHLREMGPKVHFMSCSDVHVQSFQID